MPGSPKLLFSSSDEIRAFRVKHQMNQSEFWSRVGVTQSGGSRYESGRSIPKPVRLLLSVVYGTDAQSARLARSLRGWKAK